MVNKEKIYCFDLDGTLCTNEKGKYKKVKPLKDRIEKVNKLYDEGNKIIILTARGNTTGIDWRELTQKQLKSWGVKYHQLFFEKLHAHIFVDDLAINANNFFKDKKDKVAIVTGGDGGIGKEIVKTLDSNGYWVSIFDKKTGIDITNYKLIEKMIKGIYNFKKRIDLLVNCAGINNRDWDRTIEVNLKAPYILSKLVFPYMKEKGGNIINITSLWSEFGMKGNPSYGASKGGLKQLTKCLAVDWTKYNIRVNNIGLGYFKTSMTKRGWKYNRKKITNRIPLKRWGEPEEIKEAIKFLIKCKYITGETIILDGGWRVSAI